MTDGREPAIRAGDGRLALMAMGAVLLVTIGWWALALWPVEGNPEWLDRTRIACFNTGPDGLPDASGWMLLIGQPLGMFGFLVLVWPREVADGLRRATRAPVCPPPRVRSAHTTSTRISYHQSHSHGA